MVPPGMKRRREDMVYAWHPSPPLDTEEGEEKRKISQFFAAGMLAPASPPEYRHGRLWAVGAGGSPAPERSTAARRAAWWQESGRRGERGQKRRAGQKNCVSAIWAAGKQDWFLVRDRGGRSMKVGARLVSRPRLRPRTAVHLPADNRL